MVRPLQPVATITNVELSEMVPDLSPGTGREVWLFVRLFTEPIGIVVVELANHTVSAAEVLTRIISELGPALSPRLAAVGLTLAQLRPSGARVEVAPPFLAEREALLPSAPVCTVVVCTRNRPDGLHRTLKSLVSQQYPKFDVLVVDSASTDHRTRAVVNEYDSQLDIRYARHPRPGLSRARNLALANVEAPVIAWLDDDAVADVFWLAELARGFATAPAVSAVSGLVVPLTLDRPEQLWFEQFGGHSKGRGFVRDVFSPSTHERQSPLYPLPPFGVGTNMAFRTKALRDIGGFDEALGAGTRTGGGEDTKVFTQLLVKGATSVYQPSAVVRHVHRTDIEGLRSQLEGYGVGLTAFYTALLLDRPATVWPLVKLLPRALHDLRSPNSLRVSTIAEDFPAELLAANRRAMLRGPWEYIRERMSNHRRRHGVLSPVVSER
jgi:glycosyltransferase involved in cell wall biosynthesis